MVVGADRVAANGDVANKIGTYPLAVLAHHHRIPFVVAAPRSTIDFSTPNGAAIEVEDRPASEVLTLGGTSTAPRGARPRIPRSTSHRRGCAHDRHRARRDHEAVATCARATAKRKGPRVILAPKCSDSSGPVVPSVRLLLHATGLRRTRRLRGLRSGGTHPRFGLGVDPGSDRSGEPVLTPPTEASGPSSGFAAPVALRLPRLRPRVRAFEPSALRTLRSRADAVKGTFR